MANPQKENGYTAIANEIMEAIARITLSPTGYKILFVVWRQTYGYNRCQYGVSDTFIAKAIGSTRPLVNREINRLIKRNIITVYKPGNYTEPKQIGFNKNYDTWVKGAIQMDTSVQIDTSIQTVDKGAIQIDTEVVAKQIPKERKSKESKKERIYTPDSQEYVLSKYLLDKILANNPGNRKPHINSWAKDMDMILRVDARAPDEVRTVIDFCQSDSFWKSNILSVGKLREKYDQLNIKRKEKPNANTGNLQQKTRGVPYDESQRENPDYWGPSDKWIGPVVPDESIDF
jgi:phage replication O-like protein O